MRGVRQYDVRGNLGGLERRRGKVYMQRFTRVKFGDRQSPDEIVEMAGIPLTDRLETSYSFEYDFRIQDGC